MKKKKNIKKYIKRFFIGIGIAVLLIILFLVIKYGSLLLKYKNEAEALVEAGGEDIFKSSLTSIVYDSNGKVLAELCGSRDSYYLDDNEIPYIVKRAFIVSEDRKFYEHSGVDYSGIARAVFSLIENEGEVTQGGSTITQQLARNIFLSHEVNLERKIKEIFIAWELEDRYDKNKILEFYINNIYFGNGLYGIEAAAEAYFNTNVTNLSVSEMVFLCAIPNNPTLYNPVTNMENTLKRRDRILKQMFEQGEIDITLYTEAINENIVLSPGEKLINNYEETFIRYCATLELMRVNGFEFRNEFETDEEENEYKEKYNEAYNKWNSMLFIGGYRIYTTIDEKMQEILQKNIDTVLESYNETNDEGIYSFQSSATCIDNATGYVVAIVGGRTQEHEGYTLNRAFQSFRQPGSSIKPLLVYTPVLEREYTPDTLVVDEKFEGGPKNATGYYIGNTNIRTAVEQSINTIAWKLLEEIGVKTGISYLKEMNFKRIVKEDYVPSVAVGGFTYGTSSYEMAAGYATIANDGIYRNPTCIRKITDCDGNIILDNGINTNNQKKIYQSNATRMMTDILKGVLTNGTGRKYNIDNAICAGKTGTTNDVKDVWFAGYSHYYTAVVWCGYDLPQTIDNEYGKDCAGLIWQGFMREVHEGKDIVEFNPYIKQTSEYSEDKQETTTERIATEYTSDIDIPTNLYDDNNEQINTTFLEEDTITPDKDGENDGNDKNNSVDEETTDFETDNMEQYTTVYTDEGLYIENWD